MQRMRQFALLLLPALLLFMLPAAEAEPPEALIIGIDPQQADTDDIIQFMGDFSDNDGDDLDYFYWNSSLDGTIHSGNETGELVFQMAADQLSEADIPLVWEGEVVGGLRRPDLHDALEVLIAAAETELGVPRAEMGRTQKQAAVTLLNEWGAFTLRKSVEDVAEALGVSRFTIYNYLERSETA